LLRAVPSAAGTPIREEVVKGEKNRSILPGNASAQRSERWSRGFGQVAPGSAAY
jgi:hypothetical protein